MLDKKEEENVDFDEFLNGVRTVMLYDNYFEEMEGLFKYLDQKKSGKIKRQDLLDSIAKLRQTQHGNETDDKGVVIKCELKVPNEDDLETVISTMALEEEGLLNYDEYMVSLFKVTQEGLD
jgi:Ca2+-binding EF-hand superfamily protein